MQLALSYGFGNFCLFVKGPLLFLLQYTWPLRMELYSQKKPMPSMGIPVRGSVSPGCMAARDGVLLFLFSSAICPEGAVYKANKM